MVTAAERVGRARHLHHVPARRRGRARGAPVASFTPPPPARTEVLAFWQFWHRGVHAAHASPLLTHDSRLRTPRQYRRPAPHPYVRLDGPVASALHKIG